MAKGLCITHTPRNERGVCFWVSNQVGLWLVRNCGANCGELLQANFHAPQMLRSEKSVCPATSVLNFAVRVSGSAKVFIVKLISLAMSYLGYIKVGRFRSFTLVKVLSGFIQNFQQEFVPLQS